MPFKDVVGHKFILDRLKRQLQEGALPHAVLFAGPEGVGKSLVASKVAQALVCSAAQEGEACGRCVECQQALNCRHPDLLFVGVEEGSRQIKIEQIRQLQRWLALAPLRGKNKVFVLDDADTMEEAAASALLKTLEEPPARTTLILVAASETRLLPTIVSRCARLYFGPLPTQELIQKLTAAGVERLRARQWVRRANGRFGRAQREMTDEMVQRRRAWMQSWTSAVENGELELAAGARTRASLDETRETLEEMLEEVAAWYHDVLLVQMGLPAEHLVHSDQLQDLRIESTRWPARRLIDSIEQVYETHSLIRRRVNPKTAVAALLAKLATR
ncbi:MAG: DNA polymerase III subunit delta' [Candidatus Omnitrophica bacterium]|nr:DNA polymerase III subunit delta' [Candidatus Omnitrophota bacterium]